MHGDFSRWTHRPEQHFAAVLKQQGRVEVDADANEQAAIDQYLRQTFAEDVLGATGIPFAGGGFGIQIVPGNGGIPQLQISAGRMYVDGILCELARPLNYAHQPLYPLPEGALQIPPDGPRTDLVYLDVWQRHITAIEDPHLRDVALGGPDTTTRLKTICQVKLIEAEAGADCRGAFSGTVTDATLTNSVIPKAPPDNPCVVSVGGGYDRPDNRFYRVQIHQGGPAANATYKWSRDNGAVTFRVASIDSDSSVKVEQLGRDQVLALRRGDWVELLDDNRELRGEPGVLLKVADVQQSTRQIFFEQPGVPEAAINPKLRRWDSVGDNQHGIAVSGGEVELEDGIRITLNGTTFNSGDYWFFAARAAIRDVERLTAAPPHGIRHHYAKLAVVAWPGPNANSVPSVCDCRLKFAPMSNLPTLHYVSGDGQEVPFNPNQSHSSQLCGPLQVRVLNGALPVPGTSVTFRIESPVPIGTATLEGVANSGPVLELTTDADGLAECRWQLDSNAENVCQRVTATLPGCDKKPIPGRGLAFNARLIIRAEAEEEDGLRIDRVVLVAAGRPLRNESSIRFDLLGGGIDIMFVQGKLDPRSAKRATCFVTVEDPTAVSRIHDIAAAAYVPLVLRSDKVALQNEQTIHWEPAPAAIKLLDRLLTLSQGEPLLARLTVKGSFVFSDEVDGRRRRCLDGEAFGIPAKIGVNDPFGSPATDVQLPSGDGRRGGDFQMWFWIVQADRLKSVAFQVAEIRSGTSINGTVTLAEAAPQTGANVALSISAASPTNVVSLPGFVTVPAGKQSAEFTMKTNRLPENTEEQIEVLATFLGDTESTFIRVFQPIL